MAKSREEVNARRRELRELNKEFINARRNELYVDRREAINEKRRANQSAATERHRRWIDQHPGYHRVHNAKRKGLIKMAPIRDLTKGQWQETIAYFNGYCAYCLQPMGKVTMEHMQPLSRGGSHTTANLVPSCPTCNSSKGNRTLVEWLQH